MDDDDDLALDCEKLETIKIIDIESGDGMGSNLGILPKARTTVPGQISKTTTPISLLVESLVQQLCSMLEPDLARSKKLYNEICLHLHQLNLIDESYASSEFEEVRSQYQKALYQLVAVSRGQNLPLENVWPLQQPVGLEWSRYYREFEELDFIAEGGFGKVYKVRHRLDGMEYAIKKVIIKADSVQKIFSHFNEVKTLASLTHVNIVPYKTAWLEPLMVGPISNSTEAIQPAATPAKTEDFSDIDSHQTSLKCLTDNASQNTSTDNSIQFLRDSSDENIFHISISEVSDNAKAMQHYQHPSFEVTKPHIKLKWAVLYIQMSMCQLTLRRFLDNRNEAADLEIFYRSFLTHQTDISHQEIVLNIFLQLCNGLEFCHSRGVVHHDIKPSNIFIHIDLDGSYLIQLGDFGLACPLRISHKNYRIGTPLYAAPEQLDGLCDPKSDIYSMGVILLELIKPMKTDMERHKTVNIARQDTVSDIAPAFNDLLKRLLASDLSARPTATELKTIVKMMLMRHTESASENLIKIRDLQRRLSEQTVEIESLRLQLQTSASLPIIPCQIELEAKEVEIAKNRQETRSKDVEIDQLKHKIAQLEMQNSQLKSKDEEVQRLQLMIEEILNLRR